jgi:transposase
MSEFGITLPVGHNHLLKAIQGELAKAQQEDRLPADLVVTVQEQLRRVDALQDDIDHIDHIGHRLRATIREDRQMQAIQQIPGVGELTASALVAAVGDFSTFKSGRGWD